jgi:hydrogenase nickel incorporation protein HypA/HybF
VHELAVCQALMDQVSQVAQRERARRVTSVTLQIGPLAGVEPQLLRDAWPIASARGIADGAELLIEDMPLRVRCLECGSDSDAVPNRLICGECGSFRTRLISGEELLLKSLELERDGKVA